MPCYEEYLIPISCKKPLGFNTLIDDLSVIDHPAKKALGGACLNAWQTQKAKLYMIQNMSSGVLISAVAQVCNLSRSHFSRAFRNTTGYCPRDWIRQARLIRAADLLVQTDQAISQVALECGFVDQSHLNRAFAKSLGTSPGKWRSLRKLPEKFHSLLSQFLG